MFIFRQNYRRETFVKFFIYTILMEDAMHYQSIYFKRRGVISAHFYYRNDGNSLGEEQRR